MKKELDLNHVFEVVKSINPELSDECIVDFLSGNKPTPPVKVSKSSTKLYFRTDKTLPESSSLPKQCVIVLNSITSEPINLETWTENSINNKLETNQNPKHIVMYYRPRLIELGLVEIVK